MYISQVVQQRISGLIVITLL